MKKTILYTLITAIAAGGVFAAVAYNKEQMANNQHPPRPPQLAQAPEVEVFEAEPSRHQASVTGYGEAVAHYQLTLSSEIEGQVEQLSDDFATGKTLAKGAELASIDSTAYRQALATAKATLAEAKEALLEEQRSGKQARQEWQASGLTGEPDSPLVLRAPQLAAAQANYEMAKAELVKAQADLDKTSITAPFEALIVSREIQPGSYVQTGSDIATLYSTDFVEIEIPLTAAQWQNLPAFNQLTEQRWPVTLTDASGTQQWQGYVGRVEQHLDDTARQRSLIVVVDKPLEQRPALFPGSFVAAHIKGRQLDELWQLPASALSQNGEIWLVDQQETLQPVAASARYQDNDYVYILPPEGSSQARVVVRPLSSYTSGMKVQPVKASQS